MRSDFFHRSILCGTDHHHLCNHSMCKCNCHMNESNYKQVDLTKVRGNVSLLACELWESDSRPTVYELRKILAELGVEDDDKAAVIEAIKWQMEQNSYSQVYFLEKAWDDHSK